MFVKHLFIVCFIGCSLALSAQDIKIEIESRVAVSEVPKKALEKIKEHFPSSQAKWYKEESESGISFEAKFKVKEHLLSIEFGDDGVLQDTEITIKWKELEPSIQRSLLWYFEDSFDKYKLHKIQLQYTQPLAQVAEHLLSGNSLIPTYEIEFFGKNESKDLWEGEFNESGEFISKRKIITKPSDTLQY
ncbi:MAG: hypothetical protein CMB80_22110 [Flammeovirgaceae bacterium]|nr:hypothetical protein [Flammeovirgaceae bacterium]MBR06453.1 hypothetical protein [Rickettsiales bacterium]HCX21812.1 hypothetical protein [Cytophagales bacterium]|tara:strand:+ start:694 stop:1260 length:567 start_codon:yes stop_codon:yes gene_type:complete